MKMKTYNVVITKELLKCQLPIVSFTAEVTDELGSDDFVQYSLYGIGSTEVQALYSLRAQLDDDAVLNIFRPSQGES
jgi:hypothetical protein